MRSIFQNYLVNFAFAILDFYFNVGHSILQSNLTIFFLEGSTPLINRLLF